MNTTVDASVGVTETIGAAGLTLFASSERRVEVAAKRFQEKATSSAVTALPLVGARSSHFKLGCSLKVRVSLSAENSHEDAA